MVSPRSFLIAASALVVALAAVACGDDDSDEMSADEIVRRVEEAIAQPGMVFHAEGTDGSEVWLDPENQRYRRKEATNSGGGTSVGEGWIRYSIDPSTNELVEDNLAPAGMQPRIENPMVVWYEPLTALGYGTELEVIGLTVADDNEVVAVNARTPVLNEENETVSYLEGRVEVDAETYLPTAFERREVLPNGATVTPAVQEEVPSSPRVRYRTTLVSVSEVPEGFFDRSVVEEEVQTLAESVEELKALGITPYWLGEQYQAPGGVLVLPPIDPLVVDASAPSGDFHYALAVPGAEPLADTVVIRMATNPEAFTPPAVEAFAGELPESSQEVTARGGEAVLFTSLLTPSDLPCPEGNCPPATNALYRRLILVIGQTAFQIETSSRVGASGDDLNGYNNRDGIIALADALVEANPPPDEAVE